ncbi:hypothetical protein F4815DRAFT_265330 [Daldinia loculata]|nr:hypothetical protein F4815DRAFT_265330 [Daldinia loculata]
MPTLTTRLPFSRTSSTDEPTEYAATRYHRAFPLQLTAVPDVPNESSGMDLTSASGDQTSSASSFPILSGGAIAGIEVGVTVCILGALCGAIVLYRRRRGKRRTGDDDGGDSRSNPPGDDPLLDKPELEGSSMARAREVMPKVELDAAASRTELSGSGPESRRGTVSPFSSLSPNPAGSDMIFPLVDSRHKSIFEMSG